MTKQEIQQRVLQNGKPLGLDKFEWDEKAKVFSTREDNLILDFNGINHITFDTGPFCTFDTGSDCTFKTEEKCVCIRRDIYEIIEIPTGKTIKLNGCEIKGYTILEELKEYTITRTVKAKHKKK